MSSFNFGDLLVDTLLVGGGGYVSPTSYNDYSKVLSSTASGGVIGGLSSLLGIPTNQDVSYISKNSPTNYLKEYVNRAYSQNGVLRYLYTQLFNEFAPDISGYVLLFMVPPHLSGYEQKGYSNYTLGNDSGFISKTAKLCPVVAVNFTAPQLQMNSAAITGTTGGQQYATELTVTDSLTVSYLETNNLDIYSFHRTWINYMFELLEGALSPSTTYIKERIIDYAASFYFVKFRPDGEYITYIGKATGCFPKDLPSTDILGNRTQNDATTVGFNYVVSDYQEVTFREGNNDSHWLIKELSQLVMSKYDSSYIGGSASMTSISPFGYATSNLLGGLTNGLVNGASSLIDTTKNTFSNFFSSDNTDYSNIETNSNYDSGYGSNENYDTDGSSSVG